jgi:ATP-binding cassette, subfamily B, bacterial MsbA
MLNIGAFYPFINSIISGNNSFTGTEGKVLGCLSYVVRLVPVEEKIVAASLFLMVIIIVSNAFGFFAEGFVTWYRYKLFAEYVNKLYGKLGRNKYEYFTEKRQGDLLYIGMNASQAVGEMFLYFPRVGGELLRIMAIIVLLLTMSIQVTLLILVLVTVFGFLVHFLSVRVTHPTSVKLQDAQSEVTSVFSESIAGIKQIKISDTFKHWFDIFRTETHKCRMFSTINAVLEYVPTRLVQIFGGASIVGSIIYMRLGHPEHFDAFLPILAIYILALLRIMPSLNKIGHYWMGLKSLLPRLRITYETLRDERHIEEERESCFSGLRREIRLENVTFSYSAKKGVLSDLNLSIPKGWTVAIVGESGSGKSTLADLLIRIYKPESGRVLIDGIDYRDFRLSEWLKHVSMVCQDTFIFNLSARDNIKMGKLDATEDEVIVASEIANAYEFIKEMPQGFDTIVGDRGIKLSGGQRQRIAIARAVIRNPDILILDEATSGLDNISEKIVQDALQEAKKNKTTIIIAHRLSTIEHADKIVVIKKGEIVEDGTHDELLRQQGHYYELYQKQKSNRIVKHNT